MYLCTSCYKECINKCIFCEICCNWQHFKCSEICEKDLKEFTNSSIKFYCYNCQTQIDGCFDFEKSLKRLSSYKLLFSAAQLEQLF